MTEQWKKTYITRIVPTTKRLILHYSVRRFIYSIWRLK